jgi:hypothetical protein
MLIDRSTVKEKKLEMTTCSILNAIDDMRILSEITLARILCLVPEQRTRFIDWKHNGVVDFCLWSRSHEEQGVTPVTHDTAHVPYHA